MPQTQVPTNAWVLGGDEVLAGTFPAGQTRSCRYPFGPRGDVHFLSFSTVAVILTSSYPSSARFGNARLTLSPEGTVMTRLPFASVYPEFRGVYPGFRGVCPGPRGAAWLPHTPGHRRPLAPLLGFFSPLATSHSPLSPFVPRVLSPWPPKVFKIFHLTPFFPSFLISPGGGGVSILQTTGRLRNERKRPAADPGRSQPGPRSGHGHRSL